MKMIKVKTNEFPCNETPKRLGKYGLSNAAIQLFGLLDLSCGSEINEEEIDFLLLDELMEKDIVLVDEDEDLVLNYRLVKTLAV